MILGLNQLSCGRSAPKAFGARSTARGPRKVQSSSSRAVCAAGGNSASLGRETGKSLSVCDLRRGLLVDMDEKAGFIFPKLDDRGEADMRVNSPAPAHTIPDDDFIASVEQQSVPARAWGRFQSKKSDLRATAGSRRPPQPLARRKGCASGARSSQ